MCIRDRNPEGVSGDHGLLAGSTATRCAVVFEVVAMFSDAKAGVIFAAAIQIPKAVMALSMVLSLSRWGYISGEGYKTRGSYA